MRRDPSGPRFHFGSGVVAPLLPALLLTLWLWWSEFDFRAQLWIYREGDGSWALGDLPFWKFLYHWGTLPAAIVAIFGWLGFWLSWYVERLEAWRRVYLFLFLFLLVGPGLIVNAVLKDHWGRPRPVHVEGLGGEYSFEPVLHIDPSSTGKSFPCGHATMGFYFAGGYFLLRRHRRRLALGLLFGGLGFGFLLGFARMAQGGHFLSDVVWAGLICHYTAMGLYYALRLDRSLVDEEKAAKRRLPLWGKVASASLLLAVGAGVLVASPRRMTWESHPSKLHTRKDIFDLHMKFLFGEVFIGDGREVRLEAEAHGHGIPGSKVLRSLIKRPGGGGSVEFDYSERVMGWFSEIHSKQAAEVPWSKVRTLNLETGRAVVRIALAPTEGSPAIHLRDGSGRVEVRTGGQPLLLSVSGDAGRIEGSEALLPVESGQGVYEIRVGEEFSGVVRIDSSRP